LCRRELESERQTVEAYADPAHRLSVLEPRVDVEGAVNEKRLGVLDAQRLNAIGALEPGVKRNAAGGQDGQVWGGLQQAGDLRHGTEEVLEVVEHQQQPSVA
jgi:hypothetical protein